MVTQAFVVDSSSVNLWRINVTNPIGLIGVLPSGLTSPSGIALDTNGDALVVDASGSELWRINVASPSSTAGTYGLIGTLPTGLTSPTGIVLDSNGDALVVDFTGSELWRINVASPNDETGVYGLIGSLPSGLGSPHGITLDTNGDALVLDNSGDELWRINVATPNDETGDYGLIGTLPSGLTDPRGITLNSSGDVFVLDNSGDELWRINVADPDDETGVYGDIGSLPTGLGVASGIAIDSDSDALVVDASGTELWRINVVGNLIGDFPTLLGSSQGITLDANGDALVVDTDGDELWRVNVANPADTTGVYGLIGTLPAGLTTPLGIAIDSGGDALIVDASGSELWRINVASPSSTTGGYGLIGTFPSGLTIPLGIAIDANGDALVVDTSGEELWRINVANPNDETGNYGNIGTLPSGLTGPTGITLDSNGDALVVNTSGDDIWRINVANPSDTTGVYGIISALPTGLTSPGGIAFLRPFPPVPPAIQDAIITDDTGDELWRVNIFSPSDATGPFGLIGDLPSGLTAPLGIAIDNNGDALVIDNSGDELWRVNVLNSTDTSGNYGLIGSLPTGLDNPLGIAVAANGDAIIVDSVGDDLWRVNVASPSSTAGDYGRIGSLPAMLSSPQGMALDANGDALVVDFVGSELWRINVTTPNDETGIYGDIGTLPSGLTGPTGIAIDSGGDALIVDALGDDIWRVNVANPSDTTGDYGLIGTLPAGLTTPNGISLVDRVTIDIEGAASFGTPATNANLTVLRMMNLTAGATFGSPSGNAVLSLTTAVDVNIGGTATFGTFTASATATKEEDITNVNLGGQASFGSFAAAGTLTTETTTVTPHSQTVTGLGIFDTSSSRWFLNSFQLATEPWRIDDELLADPSVATYFSNIVIFDDGRVQLRLDDAPLNVFGDDPGPEFSNAFENDGTTVLTSTGGGSTITLTLTGITDTTEPYVWTPTNSQEVIDFFTASVAQGTDITSSVRFAIGETAATNLDIAGAATFGSPSSTGALTTRTGLMLSDFDTTGLVPDALALITAGPPPSMFGRSPRPSDGMIQDGEIDISSMDEPITWLRFRDAGTGAGGARISLNDDGPLEQSGYFGTGGNGLDLTVWVQTADGNISFPVMGSVAGSGGNYVIFNVPAADQAFVAGITEGQSFIFALTRPATELAITGAATFGSPSTEATLTLVPIVNIDLVASPTFGSFTSTGTLGLVGITDVSIAGAASFGDPTTTGTVVTSITLLLAEFNANGRETDVLGLILSGPPPIIYGISPRTIGGMLVDGEMGLSPSNEPITWLRFRDSGSAAGGERISLNDNGALHQRDYFLDNDPPGGDLLVWVQTLGGVISFPVAGNVQNAGNNYVLLTVPAEHQAFVAGIAENDRLIFALARRTAFEPASVLFGIFSTAATVTKVEIVNIDLVGEASFATQVSTAALTVLPIVGVELVGAATMGSPSAAATLTKTAIIDVGVSGTASFGDFVAVATLSLLQPVPVDLTAASSFGTPSAAATLGILIPTNVEIGGSATFGTSSSSATINIRSPTDVGITGTAAFGTPAATATLNILQPVGVGLIGTASFGAATATATLDILPVGTVSVAGSASFGAFTSTGTLTTLPIVTIDHTATATFGNPSSSATLTLVPIVTINHTAEAAFGLPSAMAILGVLGPGDVEIAGAGTFGVPTASATLNILPAMFVNVVGDAAFGLPASSGTLNKSLDPTAVELAGGPTFGNMAASATLGVTQPVGIPIAGNNPSFGNPAASAVLSVITAVDVDIDGTAAFGTPSSNAVLSILTPGMSNIAGTATFGTPSSVGTLAVLAPVDVLIAETAAFGSPASTGSVTKLSVVDVPIDGNAAFGSPASAAALTKLGIVPRDITGAANFGLTTADATLEILERQHIDLAGVAAFGDMAASGVVNVIQVINVTIAAGPVTFGAPSSSAILAEASRPLPTQTQMIGDGTRDGTSNWDDINLLVDPALVPGGGTAYLRTLEIGVATHSVRMRFAPDTETLPELHDTNLIAAWEEYFTAITIEAGDLILILAGPENLINEFRDIDGEVYFWTPPASSGVRGWVDAYRTLPDSVRAATTLSLDSGIQFVNVDIAAAGTFGAASTSATIGKLQPVDLDISAAAVTFGSPTSRGTLEFFIQSLDLTGTGTFDLFVASAVLNAIPPVDVSLTARDATFGSPASTALLEISTETLVEVTGNVTFGTPSFRLILGKTFAPADVSLVVSPPAFGRFIGHALLGVNQGQPTELTTASTFGTPSSLLILNKVMVVLSQVTGISPFPTPTTIYLTWTPVDAAERYVVKWRSSNEEDFDLRNQIITTTVDVTLRGLQETTNYFVQIQALHEHLSPGLSSDILTVATTDSTLDLLIEQWRKAPRFSTLTSELLGLIDEQLVQPVNQMSVLRKIDDAYGVWLDYIGGWLDQPRLQVTVPDTEPRFGLEIPNHYMINGGNPSTLGMFHAITNGSLSLISGETATGIDLSGVGSLANVASEIQTVLRNAASQTYGDEIAVTYDAAANRLEVVGPSTSSGNAVRLNNPAATYALLVLGIVGSNRYTSSGVGSLADGSLVVSGNANVGDITINDIEYNIISNTTGHITMRSTGGTWTSWVAEADFAGHFLAIRLGDTSGNYGLIGTLPTGLDSPLGIAVAANGDAIIVDSVGDDLWRINVASPDDETGVYGVIGTLPSGLSGPTGIAIDSGGDAIIVDASGRELWRINVANPSDTTGVYGLIGDLPSGMTGPNGITLDSSGDALIVDVSNRELWRINVATPGDETGIYGYIGTLPSGLAGPTGITLDASGDALIVDALDDDIWRINVANPPDTTGVYGLIGTLPSGLTGPQGMALDANGDALVVDSSGDDLWRINVANPSSTASTIEVPLAFANRDSVGSNFITWNVTGTTKTAFDNIVAGDQMTLTVSSPLVRALGWDIGEYEVDASDRTTGFDQAVFATIVLALSAREPIGDLWYQYILHLRNGYLQTDGTVPDLTGIVDGVFPGARYVDNRDMTADLVLPGIDPALLQVLRDGNIFQSPPGVSLTITN